MSAFKPIAYTVGEPAGIGMDIIIQLAQTDALSDVVCIGDVDAIKQRAEQLGLSVTLVAYPELPKQKQQLRVLNVPLSQKVMAGELDIAHVPSVINMLNTAIDGCKDGTFSAMVTGPLHKGIINDAGVVFSGHTEYLAERTNAELPVMMLATDALRVALVTTHLPLKDVSAAVTKQRVMDICRITYQDLQTKFNIEKPKMLVCGLNPHAGEGGHLGYEEIDTIIPALDELRKQGIETQGPLPADTAFTEKCVVNADVVIAMYHDQGLPVLKAQGFGQAANITLGLSIKRTSVDHGTALDLAATGQADIGSLQTALNVARAIS